MCWVELPAACDMSSAPRDGAIVARSISEPSGVNARRRRITYSREFLLAVGSSEACERLPDGINMSKHPDDATLWSSEAASRATTEPWRARSVGTRSSGGSQGDLPQWAREPSSKIVVTRKPCTNLSSAAGCSFGENCHFIHSSPAGYQAATNASVMQGDPAPWRPPTGPAAVPATPTVRPARPCHSVLDEGDLGKQYMSMYNSTSPLMDRWLAPPASQRAPQPTTPSLVTATSAPVSFGASATTKISFNASLAGAIIGRDGANIQQISRVSGAMLRVRDHESDPGLKNLLLQGTFDQIKDANSMVMKLVIAVGGGEDPPPTGGSLRVREQCSSFKTSLCGHLPAGRAGSCAFGDGNSFAHSESELRIRDHESGLGLKNHELEGTFDQRNDPNGTATGMLIRGGNATPPTGGGQRNGFKTKLCGYFARGSCNLGDGCPFAHRGSELRIRGPDSELGLKNLELEGTFYKIKDTGSMVTGVLPVGGNASPRVGGSLLGGGQSNGFKTRLCGYFVRGNCTFGDGCRFAHGESELRIGREQVLDTRSENLELGRAFDQIRDAMVVGMLIRVGGGDAPLRAGGSLHDGRQLHSFKTKLCAQFAIGSCRYGDRCHFAHGESELPKPAAAPAARDPRGW